MIKDKEYYKQQLQLAIEQLAHKEAVILTLRAEIKNISKESVFRKNWQNKRLKET